MSATVKEMDRDRIASMRNLAQWYHELGPDTPNLAPLGGDKRPVVTGIADNGRPWRFHWQEWQETRQTASLWQAIRSKAYWSECYGVAIINGFGGWACIDIDSRAKDDPTQPPIPRSVVEEFLSALGLPTDYAWLVASPTGGWHIYVIVDTLDIDKGKLDRLHSHPSIDHVELRYTGHYTALPGSLHPNGKLYEWANAEPTSTPAHVDGSILLAAYLGLTHEKPKPASPARTVSPVASSSHTAYVAKAVAEESARVSSAAAGARNDTLNASAFSLGTLVGAGALPESDAEAALLSAAQACGLTEVEALGTIRSGLDAGKKEPRQIPESAQRETGDDLPDLFASEIPEHWGDDSIAVPVAEKKSKKQKETDDTDVALTVSEMITMFAGELGVLSLCEMDDRVYLNKKPANDIDIAPLKIRVHDHNGALKKNSDMPYVPIGAVDPVVLQIASRNRFHPIGDWLNNLEWDGQPHIANLAEFFTDSHPPIKAETHTYSVFACLLTRWLIGAVSRVFLHTQNPLLVLAGPQGIGKSFLPNWLAAPAAIANGYSARANPYFCEGNIDPDSIEHMRRLVTKFVWEVGEVGATTRRADKDALKGFLTETAATFRIPFARYEVTKPALCSWIATINPTTGYLNDKSGNRRYRTVEIKYIDWNYSTAIDAAQVWAQAVHLWRSGETNDLTPLEMNIVSGINADHETTDETYEGILERYEIQPGRDDWYISTLEVANDLIQNVPACKNQTTTTKVGLALIQILGPDAKSRRIIDDKKQTVYIGIRKSPDADNQRPSHDWARDIGL